MSAANKVHTACYPLFYYEHQFFVNKQALLPAAPGQGNNRLIVLKMKKARYLRAFLDNTTGFH
jgi:hypothetical protein